MRENAGAIELSDLGRRYVRSADPAQPFDVSPGQAEWLRRVLRERHVTDSIWHGAAIGLGLSSTVGDGDRIEDADFGRAAYLGRTGWDNENTFRLQGERLTRLLRDLELTGPDRRLTPTGAQVHAELGLPVHARLADLVLQLNPDAVVREAPLAATAGAAGRAARARLRHGAAVAGRRSAASARRPSIVAHAGCLAVAVVEEAAIAIDARIGSFMEDSVDTRGFQALCEFGARRVLRAIRQRIWRRPFRSITSPGFLSGWLAAKLPSSAGGCRYLRSDHQIELRHQQVRDRYY